MPSRTVQAHLGAQRFVLHYEQGRPEAMSEVFELGRSFGDGLGTATWTWQAICGVAHAEAGDEAAARRLLEAIAAGGFDRFPRYATWLGGMGTTGRLAAAVGDAERAAAIHGLLAPYAGRACMIGPAVVGPVDTVLGLLTACAGRWEEAHEHFAQAVEYCSRMGLPSWAARSRQEWAEMLVARGRSGDFEHAQRLAAEASAVAEELGMAGVAARARVLLETRRDD
jgi:hypothetical protein